MADFYRYSNSFDPILLEGMSANLFGSGIGGVAVDQGLSVRCVAVQALPEYVKDFGALTAGVWSTDGEDSNLEMSDLEMAQFRMKVIDDIQVRMKNPSSVTYWMSNKHVWHLSQFPWWGTEWEQLQAFVFSEFFIWQDDTPRFDLYSDIAVPKSRIEFSGWRFKLRKTQERGRVDLWVNSWPASR